MEWRAAAARNRAFENPPAATSPYESIARPARHECHFRVALSRTRRFCALILSRNPTGGRAVIRLSERKPVKTADHRVFQSDVIPVGYRDALFVDGLYGSACKEIVPFNGSNSGSL